MSYNEALLHGINEWIEKYSISLFVINHFFSSKKNNATLVNKCSLPRHMCELIYQIEEKFNDKLSIVLLKNEFGVPCILTHFNHQPDCIAQPKGFSCSLDRQYALEKSILEALQCRLLRNHNAVAREKTTSNFLDRYAPFFNAYKLSTLSLDSDIISYQEIPTHSYMEVSEQIVTLSRLLEKEGGYKIYQHIFNQDYSLFHSLHVLIPGLNESFLIKEGKLIYEK